MGKDNSKASAGAIKSLFIASLFLSFRYPSSTHESPPSLDNLSCTSIMKKMGNYRGLFPASCMAQGLFRDAQFAINLCDGHPAICEYEVKRVPSVVGLSP